MGSQTTYGLLANVSHQLTEYGTGGVAAYHFERVPVRSRYLATAQLINGSTFFVFLRVLQFEKEDLQILKIKILLVSNKYLHEGNPLNGIKFSGMPSQ